MILICNSNDISVVKGPIQSAVLSRYHNTLISLIQIFKKALHFSPELSSLLQDVILKEKQK